MLTVLFEKDENFYPDYFIESGAVVHPYPEMDNSLSCPLPHLEINLERIILDRISGSFETDIDTVDIILVTRSALVVDIVRKTISSLLIDRESVKLVIDGSIHIINKYGACHTLPCTLSNSLAESIIKNAVFRREEEKTNGD